ncbi:Aspartate aminotransferase [Phytophthora nicotianae]|uniref:Aspartate aminotransferase n=1 Tax=Phytophthora nicotianae TaxID=4792 RepID=A0A0W8AYZ0_PHYNI|nr:Aspartate aminotransferase [Phytophthora nicotianae]
MARHATESAEIEAAVDAVQSGSMSLREAARKFDVPRTTLQRRVQRRVSEASGSVVETSDQVQQEAPVVAVADTNNQSDTSNEDAAEANGIDNQIVAITGRKRSASHLDTPSKGLPELCDDIAAWGTSRLHIKYTRDDVLVGPGTKELLFVLQTVYYGDLLLPNPSCTSYAPQAAIAGRNMMWLPTHAEDHFVLRPEVLEAHCAKDADAPRILILNSPSNPTGCAYQADELEALAKVARKYRILVVSDEIYSELHHSGTHLSLSKYYPEGTIVSGGLSKWCGAGGWRMGFWLFPPSMDWLRSSMLVMASETYTSVASPIQHAARRAFVPNCIELASYKRKCQKTLQLIGRWFAYQLQKMDVEVQVPEAGFYLFPCFRRHRKALALKGISTDEQLCAQLLQDTGVAILPGSAFGRAPDELFARLAFVDFKGDLALYLIESMQDDPSLEAIEGFIQSVCPNLDIAMRKLAAWMALARPSAAPATAGVGY